MQVIKDFPVHLQRDLRISLTDQLYDGVHRAIAEQYYTGGDRLPTLENIAKNTGASVLVVRNAFRRLIDEGTIVAKRKTGMFIASPQDNNQLQVAILNGYSSFYYTETALQLSRYLCQKGISSVHLAPEFRRPQDAPNLRQLEVLLKQKKLKAIFTLDNNQEVFDLAKQYNVPIFCSFHEPSYDATCVVNYRKTEAINRLLEVCLKENLRKIVIFSTSHIEWEIGKLSTQLFNENINVMQQSVDILPSPKPIERYQQKGYEHLSNWLQQGHNIPDMFIFTDDYFTHGALLALTQHGVKVPEDVHVVTTANAGSVPYWPSPLYRIICDPQLLALALSEQFDLLLHGEQPQKVLQLQAEFKLR